MAAAADPAALLRADRGVVAFTGRDAELAELQAWSASAPAQSVRVLTGAGGAGKTRLALEVAARWEADGGAWRLVAAGEEAQAVGDARAAAAGRLLLVVDHAETRPGLGELLRAAVEDPGPIRVLLVTRSLGEWWERLIAGSVRGVARLLTGTEPLRLDAPVCPDASDADIAESAVPYFARALSADVPARVEVERAARRAPVLLLHGAALVALLRFAAGPGDALRVVISDEVLDELLEQESRHWRRAAAAAALPGEGTLVNQAIAAIALVGARSVAEAAAVLMRVPELADGSYERRLQWARWLDALYPAGSDGRLGRPWPDLLAETHVAAQLAANPDLARSCLRDLAPDQAEHALTLLAGASAHDDRARPVIAAALRDNLAQLGIPAARVAQRTPGDLGALLAEAIGDAAARPEVLADLALAMPYPSAVLAQAHLTATLRALKPLPAGPDPQARAQRDDRAGRLLAQLDRHADALEPAQEAVIVRRELAAASPARYRPELAASLINIGARFAEAGRSADALRADLEALSLYRELASASPGRYRADLAGALTSLAVRCSEAERPGDALGAEQEAVTIYRQLATTGPGQYRADLAASLTNLGVWFSEVGRPADAVPPAREAVTIYGQLATTTPGEYQADLAASLTNLAIWFSELGRPADALSAEQQAVAIRRELAAARPDRYRPDLATALANIAITYAQLGRPADALPAIKEAVTTYRELANAEPDRYRPDLARTLASLGTRYAELGRPAAAVPPLQEAVTIRRKLAAAGPGRYRPDLARSLASLGDRLAELGRPADAVAPDQEAAAAYRELAAASPGRYRSELARALSSLAVALSALGRDSEAAQAETEAAEIMQEVQGMRAGDSG